jgi:hypothetical protein
MLGLTHRSGDAQLLEQLDVTFAYACARDTDRSSDTRATSVECNLERTKFN